MSHAASRTSSPQLPATTERRLARYLAAAGGLAVTSTAANAGVVGNNFIQPFGVNEEVNIDFNGDGQTDFQIDHDRVNAGGTDYDFLQIDKNDVNGAANPLAFDPLPGFAATTFDAAGGTPNDGNNAKYMIGSANASDYPAALTYGATIGPDGTFDFQEGDNFAGSGKWIRANRLIDEDATTIDQVLGGRAPSEVAEPTNGPNFVGLGGEVRYLGVQMDLNASGQINYGWIGVRIDNEADATGAVVGYAFETTPGVPIGAGVIPEPGSVLLALGAVASLCASRLRRRDR
ncbi:MAG: hypothetical protein KDA61_18915 [Planctomycetales bacterium]|nr:hypothetical protein [Planctomycetales bacterium]